MGQFTVVMMSILAGVILGVLSNWFYDLLRSREILPERPTLKTVLFIVVLFVPFMLLVALPSLLSPNSSFDELPCEVIPKQQFGNLWETYKHELGCPKSEPLRISVAEQPFERGHVFWFADELMIYVAYDMDGIWESYKDEWRKAPTPLPPIDIPSQELQLPVNGIGKIWYEELGGPNSRLGFALYKEQLFQDWYWEFDEGFVLKDSDQTIYLFLDNGTLALYKE